jgi:hypothetical protein
VGKNQLILKKNSYNNKGAIIKVPGKENQENLALNQ